MRKYDTAASPAGRAAARDGTRLRRRNTRTASNGGHRAPDLCAAARRMSRRFLREFASGARRFTTISRPIPRPYSLTNAPAPFTDKKHDRAKIRMTTPDGARRDTAPIRKIPDGRCDTFPANRLIAPHAATRRPPPAVHAGSPAAHADTASTGIRPIAGR
ncbi:hypothetical protein [Burkholderia cepacia]|uniref:hypothetical protein n=1 Tax=Burkholderia cepacia TaxID=292 RepID=UPI0012D8A935|nr:hypothetical protein [Burkholderia cepacia]